MASPVIQDNWSTTYTILLVIKAFGTWILLFTNMVPISLLVTLEICKFLQARFITYDWEIFDQEKDMPTLV
jgi:phospholipid-transporting ATPase